MCYYAGMTGQRRFYAPGSNALVLALMSVATLSACSSSQSAAGGAGGNGTTGGHSGTALATTVGGTSVGLGGTSASATTVTGGTGTGGAATGGVTASVGSAVGGATNPVSSAVGGRSGLGGSSNGGASALGGSAAGGVVGTGGKGTAGSSSVSTGGSSTAAIGGGAATGGATTSVGSAVGGATNGGVSGTAGAATGGTKAQGGATNGTGGQGGAGGAATCVNNRALSMSANGTNSDSDSAYAHVEVDLKTDLPIANAKRTVEFWMWVKTTDWVGDKNEVYYYGVSGSTATAFGLDFGTNTVTGSTSNHATLDPFTDGGFSDDSKNDLGITSASDQWVHAAMVWDGTVLKTYVNGLPKITTNGSGGITALATGQSVLLVGCNPENKACFNGYFSDFRVWNVARTDTEIKDNYNRRLTGSEAGLVAYLKFDEAAGSTTAADAVTTTGHTAHVGTLKADTAAHNPTFITPTTAVPITCP